MPIRSNFQETPRGRQCRLRVPTYGAPTGLTVTATLYEIANGGNSHMVQVVLTVQNAPPGMHGVHIHGAGRCEGPDFMSAGGHFDPGPAGSPETSFSTRVTMGGPTGLFDADGSAIVSHQNLDPPVPDHQIACGVVVK